MIYDHTRPTRFTTAQCAKAVGKRATLHLTGTITEQRESDAGPFVMFDVDERWGLGNVRLGFDLDALEIDEPPVFPSPEYDHAHGIDLQRSAIIGRGPMKSRWLAVLLLAVFLLAVALVAGCGGDDDEPLTPGGNRMGAPRYHDGQGMEIRILTYRGRDLYCIEAGQLGSKNGYALSCDFIAWHEANRASS